MVWEERISGWLNKGKMITGASSSLAITICTPAVASLLSEYEHVCHTGDGKVIILYGIYGSGKSMTLRALVKGPSLGSWCPFQSLYVELAKANSGNDWFQKLAQSLRCNDDDIKTDGSKFASALIKYAKTAKTGFDKLKEKFGKTPGGVGAPREYFDIIGLEAPDRPCDNKKKPVIAIDNVDFPFKESEIGDENHSQFFSFARALKDIAHSAGVVVVFGTKNLQLTKAMSVFNGFSKIAPARISRQDQKPDSDDLIVNEPEGLRESLYLRGTMGWSEKAMEECIRFHVPNLPDDAIKIISKKYGESGNIREAYYQAVRDDLSTKPKTRSIATSTTTDSSEATQPSLSTSLDEMTMTDKSTGSDGHPNKVKTKSTGTSMDSSEALRRSLADEILPSSTDDTVE